MNCENVQALFSEYFDKETELVEDISLHLDGCPVCSKEFLEYYSILADVASIEEPDVPYGFREALVSYTDGFVQGRKKRISITNHRIISAISSLAAAAAVVLVAWFSGVFDTGFVVYENPRMLAEFTMPQAVAGAFDEAFEVSGVSPRLGHFDFGDEAYDFIYEYPLTWPYMTTDEFTGEEISAFIIPESDDFDFIAESIIEPVIIGVGYMGNPVVRPRFVTAVVFLIIGLFLGFSLHRLVNYIERKSDNAP